jgi:hypothetical protein
MSNFKDWQENGICLAGILVDAVEVIQAALPLVKDRRHRKEIERFLRGKSHLPSRAVLESLEAAIIANMMMRAKR